MLALIKETPFVIWVVCYKLTAFVTNSRELGGEWKVTQLQSVGGPAAYTPSIAFRHGLSGERKLTQSAGALRGRAWGTCVTCVMARAVSDDGDRTLHCALSSLRPFLAQFGLVPSRIIPYFSSCNGQDPPTQCQQFPSKYCKCSLFLVSTAGVAYS